MFKTEGFLVNIPWYGFREALGLEVRSCHIAQGLCETVYFSTGYARGRAKSIRNGTKELFIISST